MTWNGNKVKTFDGLSYAHPLQCSYTLVQDSVLGSYSIVLRGCPQERDQIECSVALQMYIGDEIYTIERRKTDGTMCLFTTKKELPLPMQMLGIRANIVGNHVKVHLEVIGLTIIWDMEQMVTIEASVALFNRTAGLCGTLDQNPNNDFRLKTGATVKTTAAFVDGWRLQHDDRCKAANQIQVDDIDYTTCDDAVRNEAKAVCKKLVNNAKFGDCLKTCHKEEILQSCINSYCFCEASNRNECVCDEWTVLARDCQIRGIDLDRNWRDTEICPMKCKPGRVYKACGPSFEPTCGSVIEPQHDTCNEGCFCPDGMVQHNDKCIRIDECPCTLRGREFKTGSEVRQDCNTCRCERGVWKCSDETCGARCSAIGDPHYQTFDGKRYDFMGKCSYYLLKQDNFSIEAENVACSGQISENANFGPAGAGMAACTKSVTIRVRNNGANKVIKLKQNGQITVDGNEIQRLPIKILNGLLIVRQVSSIIVSVTFDDGLKVLWDGMTSVYIDAPNTYRNRTQGLCGTFNSNQQDDFLTPQHDIEPAVASFANKWQTKDTCEYVSDSTEIPHPCQLYIENKQKAQTECAKLKSNVFDACSWYVNPEPYYENCMYDVCACKGDTASCLCTIFASYASECARQGVPINWRHSVKECAVQCPAGQVFEECGDECFRTCADLQSNKPCKKSCVEGCRCPPGQVLDDQNECVPIASCPCSYKGLEFKPGYKEVRPGTKFLELWSVLIHQILSLFIFAKAWTLKSIEKVSKTEKSTEKQWETGRKRICEGLRSNLKKIENKCPKMSA